MSEGGPAALSGAPTVRTSAPFLVAGCSSVDPAPDTAAKAQLDRARGQAVLPLEECQATVDELNVTQRVSQSVLRECLNRRGHAGLAPAADSIDWRA